MQTFSSYVQLLFFTDGHIHLYVSTVLVFYCHATARHFSQIPQHLFLTRCRGQNGNRIRHQHVYLKARPIYTSQCINNPEKEQYQETVTRISYIRPPISGYRTYISVKNQHCFGHRIGIGTAIIPQLVYKEINYI